MIQGITLLLNFLLLIGVSLSEPHMYEKYRECVCVYIVIVRLAVTFYI